MSFSKEDLQLSKRNQNTCPNAWQLRDQVAKSPVGVVDLDAWVGVGFGAI